MWKKKQTKARKNGNATHCLKKAMENGECYKGHDTNVLKLRLEFPCDCMLRYCLSSCAVSFQMVSFECDDNADWYQTWTLKNVLRFNPAMCRIFQVLLLDSISFL